MGRQEGNMGTKASLELAVAPRLTINSVIAVAGSTCEK